MIEPESIIKFIPEEVLGRHDKPRKLIPYFELLQQQGRSVNLVSRETIASGLPILAAESLLPFDILAGRKFSSYLDIGSGGGFPSIPIILTQPVQQACLIERDFKKAVALEHMLKQLPITSGRVRVFNRNFEEIRLEGKFDLITLRLVKLTSKLVKQILPVMAPAGILVYYATPEIDLNNLSIDCESHYYHRLDGTVRKSFSIIKKN